MLLNDDSQKDVQFPYGSINNQLPQKAPDVLMPFQFLNGSINVWTFFTTMKRLRIFNSPMVRKLFQRT